MHPNQMTAREKLQTSRKQKVGEMKKAIETLKLLLIAAVKSGASHDFILGIQNSIEALKEVQNEK